VLLHHRQALVPPAVEVIHVQKKRLGVGDIEQRPRLVARVSQPAVFQPIVKQQRAARLEAGRLGAGLGVVVHVGSWHVVGGTVGWGQVDQWDEHVKRVEGRDEAFVAVRQHVRSIRVPWLGGRAGEGEHAAEVGEGGVGAQGGVDEGHPGRVTPGRRGEGHTTFIYIYIYMRI